MKLTKTLFVGAFALLALGSTGSSASEPGRYKFDATGHLTNAGKKLLCKIIEHGYEPTYLCKATPTPKP